MVATILEHFSDLEDPRGREGRLHYLSDMVAIVCCAVICGADEWTEIETFGKAKEAFFRKVLSLPHGIPSHDTFGRVFSALRPESLERCFMSWTQALAEQSGGRLIAIDGKTLRRSFDRAAGKAAIHMVSAWSSDNALVFGQLATEAKSNEITAIPKLLELLDLQGATVTIDAEGCQKEIARKIVDGGGDYVLALKANQPTMQEEVRLFLDDAIARGGKASALGFHQSIEGDHGRIETRRAWVSPEVGWFEDREQWKGLRSFIAVECERIVGEKTSCERRYFISSLTGSDAEAIAHAVRSHWSIENSLHWCLDVAFREDMSRIRQGHAAENLSRIRRLGLGMLKRETSAKIGIKGKRLRAGWDEAYLLRVLAA